MNSPRLVVIDGNIDNNDDNMCILVIANYLLFYRVLLSLIVDEFYMGDLMKIENSSFHSIIHFTSIWKEL